MAKLATINRGTWICWVCNKEYKTIGGFIGNLSRGDVLIIHQIIEIREKWLQWICGDRYITIGGKRNNKSRKC